MYFQASPKLLKDFVLMKTTYFKNIKKDEPRLIA